MRDLLTILAALLLVVLALALAVPPFIDWSAYAPAFATRLGAALGARVEVAGPVSVRLLPSPHLSVGRLGIDTAGVALRADGATVELALAPLLRGAVSIQSARVDRPQVTVDTRVVAHGAIPANNIGIDRVVIRDATILIVTERGTRRIDRLDVTASADSTAGPFRAEGFWRVGTRVLPFKIATGAVADGRLLVKADVEPLAGLPRMDAAGTLIADPSGLRFEGTATASDVLEGAGRDGVAALPWRIRLDGTATADEATIKTVEARAGTDADRLLATGDGALAPTGRWRLTLRSERPDIDRFRRAYDVQRIARALRRTAGGGAFAIDWRAETVLLGREVVADARAVLRREPDDPSGRVRLDASAAVTRDGLLSFAGATEGETHIAGDLSARTSDAPALARWLRDVGTGDPASVAVPADRLEVAGRLDASTDRMELRGLRATLDRSTFTGDATFVPAGTGRTPLFQADLQSDALDIDALPDLTGLPTAAAGLDLALSLDARAVRVARLGRTAADAGRVSLRLTRAGDVVRLDRLTLENIGGATLQASGRLTTKDAHVQSRLEGRQLADLFALLRRAAPGAVTDALAARAAVLSPAVLDATVDAIVTPTGALVPRQVLLFGKLAETSARATLVSAAGDPDGFTGSVLLDAPDAGALLRQAGIAMSSVRTSGAAHVEAKFAGRGDGPLHVTAATTLAGSDGSFEGAVDPGDPSMSGDLRVNSRDILPLLRMFAGPVDAGAPWPAQARAHLDAGRDRYSFSAIDGRIAGAAVTGTLARTGRDPIGGRLHVDRIDLASIAALVLGRPSPTGSTSSALRFAPPPPDPPPLDIELAADRLGLPGGLVGTDASATLAVRPGLVEAKSLRIRLSDGEVTGGATLRRGGDTASVSAKLDANAIALTAGWSRGRLSGTAEVTGAGTSAAGLVASVSGRGTMRVEDATLAGADPQAPARVARAVDAEEIELQPATIAAALDRALVSGPQTLPPLTQPVRIDGGQVILAPFAVPLGSGDATLSGRWDGSAGRLVLQEVIRAAPPEDWSGPPPAATLLYDGPIAAPRRTIDAGELIGTLAAHGLVREETRIAALDADRRERAFFNRRLRHDRALEAERKAEEARAEAARLEAIRAEDTARREALRQEALRQEAARKEQQRRREAERLAREKQAERAMEDRTPVGRAPLELRPPNLRPDTGTPSIIAPDPSTSGRF